MAPLRLAYLVSHPIQYHAPLLRALSADSEIDLKVFFCSTMGATTFFDPEFGQEIAWQDNILDGYDYEFLPALGGAETISTFRPFNHGLMSRLKAEGFDLIWIHGYARLFNLLAAFQAKLCGVKVVVRDDATLLSRSRAAWKKPLKRLFFAFMDLFYDGYLSVGTRNTEYYLAHGIPEKKIFEVPYVVNNDYFREQVAEASPDRMKLQEELGLDPSRSVILFAGKLIQQKSPQDLLQAFEKICSERDVPPYLVFVGDGPLRDELEQQAKQSVAADSIRFTGFVPQQEIARYFDLCDIFVLPSFHETWGLVVNEVMNAGKPIVLSSRVGCAPDLVDEGINGHTYPAGDIPALERVLIQVLSDEKKRKMMGEKSLEKISHHTYESTLAELRQVFQTVG